VDLLQRPFHSLTDEQIFQLCSYVERADLTYKVWIDLSIARDNYDPTIPQEDPKDPRLPLGDSALPEQHGMSIWHNLTNRIADAVCDTIRGVPKESIMNYVDGDTKDLIVAVATAIMGALETTLAVATPLTAIVFKTGLVRFCELNKKSRSNPDMDL